LTVGLGPEHSGSINEKKIKYAYDNNSNNRM